MRNVSLMVRGMVAASALMLVAAPAFAGDEERARAAIAEAQGKIDAAVRVKANDVTPDQLASAQASLKLAQEELKSGHEQKAIQAAIQSQQFADTAIGRVAQRQSATVNAQSAVAADAQADAAAADARAARSAPPVVVAPTPAPTTTVTAETVRSAVPARTTRTAVRRPVKKTVKRTTTAPRAVTTKTTTTVTTN
jgi:hypothetical protein